MNHPRRAAVPKGEPIRDVSFRPALKFSPKETIFNVSLSRKMKTIRTPMKRFLSGPWITAALAVVAGALLPACFSYTYDSPTLSVVGATTDSITLEWVAPGVLNNDGTWVSPIDSYDLRYSTTPVDE